MTWTIVTGILILLAVCLKVVGRIYRRMCDEAEYE